MNGSSHRSQSPPSRKRSRFLPQVGYLDNSNQSLLFDDANEQCSEQDQKDKSDSDSVNSFCSASSDGSQSLALDSTAKREPLDASEHSMNLSVLLAEMADERTDKKETKAKVKEIEDKHEDEISDSDDDSLSTIDKAEERERQVRSSLLFACLNVLGMAIMSKLFGKLLSKMQKLFQGDPDDAANDIAMEAADAAREETMDRAAQMAMIHAQNSSSSSLMGAPVPMPGGAETQ